MAQRRDRELEHDDLRRATHEAGHAVVATVLGWPLEYVTIDPSASRPDLLGHVKYAREVRRYSEVRIWAATFLAGREAEVRLFGSFGIGSLQDERLVTDVLSQSFQPPSDRAEGLAAVQLARATVEANLEAIVEARDALIERRTLGAAAVQAIVDRQRAATGRVE